MDQVLLVPLEVGTPRRMWCNRCMKGSGVEAPLLWVRDDGVARIGTYRECLDCDGHDLAELD